jgi:hypothetical protein
LRRRRNGLAAGLYDYNQHINEYHADRNYSDPDTYPNANSNTHAASANAAGSDDDVDI